MSFLPYLRLTRDQKFEVRKMVVNRAGNGESVRELARNVPFTSRTIFRWLARFSVGGYEALKDRKRSGRPRKFTDRQADWIYNLVVNRTPEQLRFEFALWTTNRVRQAFYRKFKVRLGKWTVRRIMRGMGLTPQRPKRRAEKYSKGRVEVWKSEEFPAIAKEARQAGALLVFADEAGVDSQSVVGQTWGVRGKTPVVRVSNRRNRINMLAAISPEGDLYFMTHEGSVTARTFLKFLETIRQDSDREIRVVVDNLRVHKAKIVMQWLENHSKQCRLFYQPTYAPEVNPVELVRALIKRKVSRQASRSMKELRENVKSALESLKDSPELVKRFFHEEDCKYISA